jgi:hypothetical protein
VPVGDLWDLVNSKIQYRSAVPVLINWLQHVDSRVAAPNQPKVREGLVRALTVSAARPAAAPVLLDEFRRPRDPSRLGFSWAVGNALSVVADASMPPMISSASVSVTLRSAVGGTWAISLPARLPDSELASGLSAEGIFDAAWEEEQWPDPA